MSGNKLALDTNVAIAWLRGGSEIAARLHSFTTFYLPSIVLGELLFGAINSDRAVDNIAPVERLAERCTVLPAGAQAARLYAELRLAQKQRGRPIPENDLWIAALCVEHDLPLATWDQHFQGINRLRLISP